LLQAKLIKGADLKVYKGAPHGLCTKIKDQVNAGVLAFVERKEARRAGLARRRPALFTNRLAPATGSDSRRSGADYT
jgi:hypothetical protein